MRLLSAITSSSAALLVSVALLGAGRGAGCVSAFQPAASMAPHRFGVRSKASTTTTLLQMSESPEGSDDESSVPQQRRGRGGGRTERLRERARTFGQLLSERMDTMGAAGYRDDTVEDESSLGERVGEDALSKKIRSLVPMQAGVIKTGLQVAVVVWLVRKWMKIISRDKMLKGDAITEAEDAELHAWTCNNCGATLYVAKGKEWRYFPKNYKCYLCGNKGRENFSDTRNEIIERVGDDYEFLDPWEALTPKEQRALLKECGGDEEKAQLRAIEMAAEKAGKDVPKETKAASEEAVAEAEALLGAGEGGSAEGEGEGEEAASAPEATEEKAEEGGDSSAEAAPEPAPAPAPAPAPKKSAPAPAPAKDDDDLDALDMDML